MSGRSIRICACTLLFYRNVRMQVSDFKDMGRVHRDSGIAFLLKAADRPLGSSCFPPLVQDIQNYIKM